MSTQTDTEMNTPNEGDPLQRQSTLIPETQNAVSPTHAISAPPNNRNTTRRRWLIRIGVCVVAFLGAFAFGYFLFRPARK